MKVVQQKLFVIVAMAFMFCLSGLVMSGTSFAQKCVDNGDGTVTDNGTGLMWQKATAGEMKWNDAMSYASGLSLGGHSDWWLPNRVELQGLYHSPCKSMVEVVSDWRGSYWSSTTNADDTNRAWRVYFYDGLVDYGNKSSSYYVRAVRSAR
jgi:hypothetical protein